MPDPNRLIGGVRCGELLPLLPDFIEGELSTEVAMQVQEHLGGCGDCSRFGTHYGALISALHATRPDEPLDQNIRLRLIGRMESTWKEDSGE